MPDCAAAEVYKVPMLEPWENANFLPMGQCQNYNLQRNCGELVKTKTTWKYSFIC